jgi:glycosyltransferase involved in cell wall biosynthesis
MKKIGLIVTNLAGSGAEKVVLHLADMFEKHGDEVHIFLLENVISYEVKGARIHTLTKDRSLFKLLKGFGDKLLALKLKSIIHRIEKDGQKFDLFLSNLPAADRVAREADLRHTKYLIHTSYSMELNEFRDRGKFRRAAKKEKLYHALYEGKELIAVSQGIKGDLDHMGINYATCEVIYNPFDVGAIRDLGEEKSVDEIEGEYLLSASAFRPVKRHDILLRAYSKLTDPLPLKLLCNSDPKLEKMIDELGIGNKVEILGFMKNPYPVIKNAKLLILSSEREGLPTVLIEALILGTPVVSTDCVSGPSEILTGELSQYLAKVNDVDDLSKKISLAIEYYPEIKESYIDKFNAENIYQKYIEPER